MATSDKLASQLAALETEKQKLVRHGQELGEKFADASNQLASQLAVSEATAAENKNLAEQLQQLRDQV